MIYTITLNPSLDYHVEVEDFKAGILNRTIADYKVPGGKGINVSRVLKRLGAESVALGFIGGFTGAYIKDFLIKEQITADFVEVDEDTRINIKLRSAEETEINGTGPAITEQQLDQLFSKFQSIQPNDTVVFSGSIPISLPSSIYTDLIKICKEIGARFVADVSGDALKQVIKQKPFLIKPNHHELGEIFQTKIESVQDALLYGKKLVDEGIENIIISMAEKGALLINKNMAILATAPQGELKNSIGAGDSLVGGFLSAYSSGKSLEEAFKIGVASGSATAFSQELCTKDKMMNLLNEVIIKTL